jgi:protein disulfide-isomerase A1
MQVGKFLKYTAICLLLSLSIFSVKCSDDDFVMVLEDSNFEAKTEKHQFLLVEFYAPWCGHCKSLEPEYKKAAQILKEQNSNIHLAKVDATENMELAKRFEIQGYPTLKFLKNGQFVEYTGGRTAEEIVQWVTKKSGPPSVQLNTVEEVEAFKTSGDFVLVYFGSENSEKFKFFNTIADKYEYSFAHSFVDAVKSHFNAQDRIVLFKNFDELRNDFDGELTENAFENFTDVYAIPIAGRFTERSIDVIFDKNRVGLFYVRSDDSAKDVEYDEVLKRIGPAYRNQFVFVISDIKDELEDRLAEYFGITEKDLPHLRIVNVINEEEIKNYTFDKDLNQDNLEKFLQDFLNNILVPTLKSEPVPETQDEAVYKVVGTTFNDVVINNANHVLVEFYATWCGHCKNFAPVYEEIAKEFNSEKSNVVVAKMDAVENEVDGVNIAGFPTVKLYKAGDKTNPIEYKGGRGKWEVYDWVKEQIDPTYQKPNRGESQSEVNREDTSVDDAIKEDL